ncbi:MAG: hypothetical protein JWM92_377 [Candidatus Nomurabacteria bacterium]|jgi:flagellar basal body-associated protein FliL|nr:hypothetical protein [Candidatus Nomurabacteria bacterium]
MEDSSSQPTTIHPVIDTMPTGHPAPFVAEEQNTHHPKKKILLIVGLVFLLLAGAVVFFLFHRKAKQVVQLTPAETLQELKNSSAPVTTTPEQRATDLTTAQKKSLPIVVTTKQKMDILNALKK